MSESSQPQAQEKTTKSVQPERKLFVVGIGASAGGLRALEELFSNLSSTSGAAFVVIQHLSPDFKSLMKELLERRTKMPVYRVIEGMELEPNSVYLIPPGQNLALEKNVLRLEDRKRDRNRKLELNFPIDLFFHSLAANYKEKSIGVILSGSGSDGTRGLKGINKAGGISLVQDPLTAEFDGMPASAIATDIVDDVLPPRELSQLIYQYINDPIDFGSQESKTGDAITSVNLSRITKLLLEEEGLDFSQYKSSTISRRIYRRVLVNDSKSIDDYIQILNNSGQERQILCSDLLINVTHFFRDYSAWQILENKILPKLIEDSKPETELRFWITACSTGEEAYSLAILVYEALQNASKYIQVKIFATDIDQVALNKASQGIYSSSIAKNISKERLQKYFVAKDNNYQIIRKIREMLIFSPHDLTKDAGLTCISLLTCRNVLIYMKPDLQYRVLRKLHFSLVPQGVLFLGGAETLDKFESEFKSLDKKWKLFQKLRDIRLPLPLRTTSKISKNSSLHQFSQAQQKIKFESILEQCLNQLSDQLDSILLLVDSGHNLLHVSGDSSIIFKAPDGKVTTEVTKMVVFPLQLPLNTALHQAKQKGESALYPEVQLEYQGRTLKVDLEVLPPQNNRKYGDFFLVKIKQKKDVAPIEISKVVKLELHNEASTRIIELENELRQTRENLQALVEELEVTNEELTVSNEELTVSNEELTVSNEEIQSTNEELHSVNEELHTVNIEYQSKIQELIQLNNDIDNLLKSTEIGVIFLDSELIIRKFTPAIRVIASLLSGDINRPLKDLNLLIDCFNLEELLQDVQSTKQIFEQEVRLKASDSYFLMRISPYRKEDGQDEGLVLSFFNIDKVKQAQFTLERALRALEQKETEVRTFFHISPEIICIIDSHGYYKQVNPSFTRILGYSPREIFPQPYINLVHPEDRKATLQVIKTILKGQTIKNFENRYRCQDGSYKCFQWMAEAYQGLIYAIAHDLTDQKLAQKSQNRQLAAIETATNGIAILSKNKFVYLNQAHVEMFGYSQPEELLGESWQIFYEQKYLAYFKQEIFPVLQDQGKWQGVVKARHRDGYLFDEELTLTLSKTGDLIFVCQNISDRLKMERSLMESENKYRYLYENTPVMLHSIDNEGRILSVNNYWLQKMGYEIEEVLGEKSTKFITSESQQYAEATVLPEFLRTGTCYNVVYQWICKDGTIIDGLLSAISETENNKITRSLAVVVDITEQRQKEKLEEANKAKDEFIAHMSHEFRTPLNSILGFSHLLSQDPQIDSSQLKYVEIINQSGKHLLTLINDVLDLSKLAANKLELRYCDLDLENFLQNIATIFQTSAQTKGLKFFIHIAADMPGVVNTDETRLRQVLLNLLSNAIKFTETGSVTLSVSCSLLSSNMNLKRLRFRVEDTGCSISPDNYETVFAPFGQLSQSTNNSDGTGLGLSICQKILQLMHSELHLDSKVGRGSIFWFDLDLVEIAQRSLPTMVNTEIYTERQTQLPASSPLLLVPYKVLVVDDNEDNRTLLIQYLQPFGFTIQEADNGQSGIAIAQKFQPDVILVDMLMPIMNGREMIKNIRLDSRFKNTIILVISANIQSIQNLSDIQCNGFLTKPINLNQLVKLLDKHLHLDLPDLGMLPKSINTSLANTISPSQEQLVELLELVDFGDMKALIDRVDFLEKTNSQYISLVTEVKKLADSCQQEKLEQFLKKLLTSPK